MAIGVKLPGWVLDQGPGEFLLLDVSNIEKSIASNVIQRTYADGAQRAISGYATRSALSLTLEDFSDTDEVWIRERTGQLVTLRDSRGGRWEMIIGDISVGTDPTYSETRSYGVELKLFFFRELN